MYWEGKPMFSQPYYSGKITVDRNVITIKVVGDNSEAVDENGKYKLESTRK